MPSFRIESDVERIAVDLRRIGKTTLRRSVTEALTAEAQPLIRAAKKAALEELPKRGGLNKWFADSEWRASIRGGINPNLTVRGSRKGHDLRAIDRGAARHPVYGHRDYPWTFTFFEPGVFTNAMRRAANREVAVAMIAAADKVMRDFEKR